MASLLARRSAITWYRSFRASLVRHSQSASFSVSSRPPAAPPGSSFDEDLEGVFKTRMPRRRWMSVTDLVTEVEQALVQGERLDEAGDVYANLQQEAARIRIDNDQLTAKVVDLESERKSFVVREEDITTKLNEDGGFFKHEAEILDISQKIQELDFKIAGLRYKHHQNVRDVGYLKKMMFLIAKRGEVMKVVDHAEEAMARGDRLVEQGPEDLRLKELVDARRDEFYKVIPKIGSKIEEIAQVTAGLTETEKKMLAIREQAPSRERDDLRVQLHAQMQQAKRMIAQQIRLRELQKENSQEIGLIDRVRAKLMHYSRICALLEEGDKAKISEKMETLQQDTSRLRANIREVETGLEAHGGKATATIARLRSDKDSFTPQSGRLREELIANIHQESQRKEVLAVLRGEKLQNIRYIAMLKKAL